MASPKHGGRSPTPAFKLRKKDIVGGNDAEEDARWLSPCFVDTGQLEVLLDTQSPQRLVLGRTGSGKSALLKMLCDRAERVAVLDPAKLSLSYVSNAPILRVLRDAGVNLEFFYKLLWRHCFCVELLRLRFPDHDASSWIAKLRSLFTSAKHKRAWAYLEECGDRFFDESDVRVRTLVEKLEQRMGAELGASFGPAKAKVSAGGTLTSEERSEFALKAQKVLPDHHRQELAEIVELVDSVLTDDQKPFYVVVDQIDENWVEEDAKYPLVMALLETVKEFGKVKNAKIVVATRVDLLRKVFETCRGSGFQEEKYESLYLPVSWTERHLVELADKRIGFTFQDQYAAGKPVKAVDVFRGDTKYFRPLDFMLERTLYRPRDVIAFLNACIGAADGHSRITKQMAEEAEKQYSESRLRSLRDEWKDSYPAVDALARILLDKRTEYFRVGDIQETDVAGRCTDHQVTQSQPWPDGIAAAALGNSDARQFIRKGIAVLCHVGAISLKLRSDEAFSSGPEFRLDQILAALGPDTAVRVHAMLARALHIKLEPR